MSVSTVIKPVSICFAKNQQFVKLTSNLFIETVATKGYFIITPFIITPLNGDILKIIFWNKTVELTYRTAVLLDGFSIPISGTLENFILFLKKNYDVNSNFDITIISAVEIKFTAKKFGNDNSLFAEKLYNIGGSNLYSVTYGLNTKIRDNFKLLFEVHVAIDSTNYEKIYSTEILPKATTGTSGEIEINIEEVLRSRLDYDILNYANSLTWANKIIKNYYVSYTEIYGVPKINHRYEQTPVFKAINAGVNKRNYPSSLAYLMEENTAKKYYLDLLYNRNIITDKNQFQTLFFLAQGAINIGSPIYVYVLITWDDNTTSNHTLYFLNSRAIGNDISIIPCGVSNSNIKNYIAAQPTKKPIKYVVSINNILLSKRTFIIDDKYYSSLKYFRYVNSMGGLTHFRTTGEYEYGAEISFDEFDKELASNYNTITASESQISNSKITEDIEVFSGFVTRYDVFLFLDFLLSEKKHEQIINTGAPENYTINNSLVEIKVDAGKVKLYKSKDGLFSYSFKYKYLNISRAINNMDVMFNNIPFLEEMAPPPPIVGP